MKRVITIISNDWHITQANTHLTLNLVDQKIKLAQKHGIKKVFLLGDIFESRQSQPLTVLKCFEEALDKFYAASIKLVVIPGNHDKTNYESPDSFLDAFTHHPALILIRTFAYMSLGGHVMFRLIPFFKEEQWLHYYKQSLEQYPINKQNPDVLLSHIAMDGSVNNDGTKIESKINVKMFKEHVVTFLGHYHNYQKVGGEVYHLPSVKQKDFGEDSNKGFTLVYEDCSFEVIKSAFKGYETLKINLNTVSNKELLELTSKADLMANHVRLKLTGSEEKVKAIKTDELKMMGFDVKTEQEDVIESIKEVKSGKIISHTADSLINEFNEFCTKEDYKDINTGLNYLTKTLKHEQ
jgi:DNA repair protein SbcD/Mre11